MNIAIFESVTTEEALLQIEAESSKYDGLHVEMGEKKERKFVKDKASEINDILKILETKRISISKNHKKEVEELAKSIRERLEAANKPFTLLIDDYAIVRAKQIAKDKELQAAKDLAFQMPIDHEEALSMNKLFDFEKSEKIREQKERDDEIAKKATEDAANKLKQAKIDADNALILADAKLKQEKIDAKGLRDEAEKQRLIDIEAAEIERKEVEKQRLIDVKLAAERATQAEITRQEAEKLAEKVKLEKLEANKKHVGKIRGQSKDDLMEALGIDELLAKKIVIAVAKSKIRNISISYQ